MKKASFGLFLAVVCLVQSYAAAAAGGQRFGYPLRKFLRANRSKKSVIVKHGITEESGEYSYDFPVYIGPQEGLKSADKITSLPGQPKGLNFDQYSGYVTVDPSAGRALFYYFAEAPQNAASTKPLVLWLNGGPGCSSIGGGAMTELGPFRVNPDGKTLWLNEYAWNSLANVLFLESPAGVGFSYSNTSSDYIVGDKRTAADSYTFLVNWLERFPEYKTRDFYITGESYAGHYVPQLAQFILHNNNISNKTLISLKGVAVGNAYIDFETQNKGTYDYAWTHALISDEIYDGIVSNCNYSSSADVTATCREHESPADSILNDLDPYNIYAPLCLSSSRNSTSISEFDPCSDNYVDNYLNTAQVQEAIHAKAVTWSDCNSYINSNWQDQPDSVLPVIQELMGSGIRVWIYSGDTDAVVPVTTTRYAMKKLGVSVKTEWYPWYYQNEVGGFVVEYENITFVSIRGAGHFVPSYQPGRALAFFNSFLQGKLP